MNRNKIISFSVGFVVVAGLAFFGGIKYDQAKNGGSSSQYALRRSNGGFGRRGGSGSGNDFVAGQIIATDSNSVTVQLRGMNGAPGSSSSNGGSKIIFLSDKSQILKSVSGTSADLTVGQQVIVTGTDNSDGSITAQKIQIRPQMSASAGQ